MSDLRVSDALPEPLRVVVVAATGLLRAEIEAACDDDFVVAAVADARAAEDAARRGTHALVVVADDLFNVSVQDLVHRIQLASRADHRTAVMVLHAHGDPDDLAGAHHAGADDVGRWPQEPDIFRARVRSMVRTATLEASMDAAAESGTAGLGELRHALAQAVHLVNNSVAGISGRAQLAALTGAVDEAGLVPVCLGEARRLSRVLSALHRLSEAVGEKQGDPGPAAVRLALAVPAATD